MRSRRGVGLVVLAALVVGAAGCDPVDEEWGAPTATGSRVVAAGGIVDSAMSGDGQSVGYIRVFEAQPLIRVRGRDGSTDQLAVGDMPSIGAAHADGLALSRDAGALAYRIGGHVVRAVRAADGTWDHTVLSTTSAPGPGPFSAGCAGQPRISADGLRVVFAVTDCSPAGALPVGVHVWSAPGVSVASRTPVWSSTAAGRLDRLGEFAGNEPRVVSVSAGGRWVGATVPDPGGGSPVPAVVDMQSPGTAASIGADGVIDHIRSDGRLVVVVDGDQGVIRRVDRDVDADGVFDDPGSTTVETIDVEHLLVRGVMHFDDLAHGAVAVSEEADVVTYAVRGLSSSPEAPPRSDRLLTARRSPDGSWVIERDVSLLYTSYPCTGTLAAGEVVEPLPCEWPYFVSMSSSGTTSSFLTVDLWTFGQHEVRVTVGRDGRLGADPDSPWAADPVNAATGNFVDQAVDLGVGGSGGFVRSYNSADDRGGVVGPGWSTPLDVSFEDLATGNRLVRLEDGRVVEFAPGSQDGWRGPPGFDGRLVDVAPGVELRLSDGTVMEFGVDGSHIRSRLPGGVVLEVERATEPAPEPGSGPAPGQVVAMSWSVGGVERHRLSFAYIGRLESITDSEGRQVTYAYRDEPDGPTTLHRVSRPHGVGADPWVAGWTEYDTAEGRITRIAESIDAGLDPVRAYVRMRTTVVNGYDSLGRVATQTTGDGATLSFAYDSPSAGLTSVTEQPSGETTVYGYDGEGRQISITDSTGSSTSQEWAAGGERGLATDRAGAQQRSLHDDDGRLRARVLPDPATGVVPVPPEGSGWQDVAVWADRFETWTYVNAADPDDHRVEAHRDPSGSVTRYGYDGSSHRVVSVTTAYGTPLAATTTTVYGTGVSADQPTRVTDPDGVVTVNDYDPSGVLVQATVGDRPTEFDERLVADADWDPAWSTAEPTAASAMVVTRPIGDGTGSRSWVTLLGADGRDLRSIDPTGAFTRQRHFDDGSVAESIDESAHVTATETRLESDGFAPRDPAGSCDGVCPTSNGWDEPAGITRIETGSDPDGVVTVSASNASRDVVEARVEGPGVAASVTRHTYGPLGRLVRSERTGGTPTAPVAQVSAYGYDVNGNPTTVTEGPTLGEPSRTTTTTYDKTGRVTDVWGPAAESPRRHNRFAYDDAGREIARIDAAEDPAARLMTSTRYDAAGRVIEVVRFTDGYADLANPYPALSEHPTAEVTRTSYTPAGKPRTVVTGPANETSFAWPATETPADLDALGFDGPRRVNRYDYDPTTGEQVAEHGPDGTVVRTAYDSVGRVDRTDLVATPGGATDPTRLIARFGYDRTDRVVATWTPWTRPDGATVEVVSDTAYWPTGRTRSDTDPHAVGAPAAEIATRGYAYTPGGRLAEVSDPNGDVVRYVYDGRGNRAARESLNSAGAVESQQTWAWTLDDRPAAWTLPHAPGTIAAGWSVTYDDRGRQVGVVDPSGRSEASTYTPSGEVAARTSRTGVDDPTPTVESLTYDGAGRRLTATTPLGEFGWVHDRLGRVTAASQPGSDGERTIAYAWDLAGSVREMVYPDAGRYRVGHDRAGRRTGVEQDTGTGGAPVWADVVALTYDGFGDLAGEALGDGGTAGSRVWVRDPSGRVSGFDELIRGGGADPDTSWATGFTWRADGRVASEITNGAPRIDFGYDPAGQLTSAVPVSGPGARSWAYASGGRRVSSTHDGVAGTYHWDVGRRRLTGLTVGTEGHLYGYDGAGRRIVDGRSTPGGSATTDYGYDDTGRLAAFTEPSGIPTTRSYGPDGQLIATRFGAAAPTDVTWDTTGGVAQVALAEWSGHTTRGFDTTRVDTTSEGGPPAFHASDAYGSAVDTPATNAPDGYGPYGETTGWAGGPFGYRGELFLDGLLHLRARDYDATTGTFTTPDPLDGVDGNPTLANGYHYTDNDPLNQVDPTGMRPTDGSIDAGMAGVACEGVDGRLVWWGDSGNRVCLTPPASRDNYDRCFPPVTPGGDPLVYHQGDCKRQSSEVVCNHGAWVPGLNRICRNSDTITTGLTVVVVLALVVASGGAALQGGAVVSIGGGTGVALLPAGGAGALATGGALTGGIILPIEAAGYLGAAGTIATINHNASNANGQNPNGRGKRGSSPNQMNQEIRQGRAPKGVERVDRGHPPMQDHVHFKDQRPTLNRDGTSGHGGRPRVTARQRDWLRRHGWNI